MIDLHLHLDGSLAPEEVLELADRSGITLPSRDLTALRALLTVEPGCRNLGEYLEKFALPLQVLQTEETIRLSVYYLLRRLAKQGLCYAEVRFAPQLHLDRRLTQQQVTAAAVAGLEQAIAETGMPAQLILCCMRGAEEAVNLETIRVAHAFLGRGVCAADLAGNEAAYPTEDFAPVFALAQQLNLPYIIHAGEAAGGESVRQALALGARRIGHGVRSLEDTDLIALLAQNQVPLETCFTSNLQTKAVADAAAYPLPFFLAHNLRATVNTDNMTVSGTTLREEYRALRQLGLTVPQLETLACNAAGAAFVTPAQTEQLKAEIARRFSAWLDG